MVEFQITKQITEGVASTLKDDAVRNIYADAVERLVKDNSNMGKEWQNRVLDLLIDPIYSPADNGDLRGSDSYMNTFLAQIGIPLIELPKLRQSYELNGNKTPFSNFYVETGLALISQGKTFERNSSLADKLNQSFKENDIKVGKGRVPNFTQLKLSPDSKEGLIFILNKNSDLKTIPNLEDYELVCQGKSGLFRAYLNSYSDWGAGGGYLEISGEDGRVVRYDAEGVVPKKLDSPKNFIQGRLDKFRKNY